MLFLGWVLGADHETVGAAGQQCGARERESSPGSMCRKGSQIPAPFLLALTFKELELNKSFILGLREAEREPITAWLQPPPH